MGTPDASVWKFFRTELGKTIRVEEANDGAVSVAVLKDGTWSEAPRGMIGLRLAKSSRSLTAAEIGALPFARVRVQDL